MTLKSDGWMAFCFIFMVTVFGLTIIYAIENAEGSWTANTYNSTTDTSASYGRDKFVHTKDDLYAVPYVSSSDDLWIAYKPTTGGSWSYEMIAGTYNSYLTVGAFCSSNNTIVVIGIRDEGVPLVSYAFVKWPGDGWDTWTEYQIRSNSGLALLDAAINNTDCIAISERWGSNLYVEVFNLTTKTVTSTSTTFYGHANAYGVVAANQSGDFFVLYGGFSTNLYMRDLNKTLGAVTITGYWYYPDLVCLPNDRFGASAYYLFGSVNRQVYWMYQNTHNGAWTKVIIETQAATDSWTYPKVMISQGSTTVWIIGYNSVDDIVYDWNASWDAVAGTWQASERIASSSTEWSLGASNSVWPKTSGISWCQPKTGQAIHFRKEDGSPDIMQIWTQDVTWTPDLTTAWPTITTASLPAGTVNVAYSHSLSKSGGTSPFEWSFITAPAWLNIGLATGILSGTPPTTGSYTVTVKLEDATGRSDTETWTLTINPAESEAEPLPEDALSLRGSMDAFLGAMWWLFIFLAATIAVIDSVMTFRKKKSGGPF